MGHRPDRPRSPGPDARRHQGNDDLTRQNRVLPTGEIVAHPARGTLMGNRGILHDAGGRLGAARWRHPHWIACRLSFRGRHRCLMAPQSYTELFFLDEAVSLAAGHRPCAECRRADYERFRDAWPAAKRASAVEIDRILHAARLRPGSRRQATFTAPAQALPKGCFVALDGRAHLVAGGRPWPYAPDGYGPPVALPGGIVEVLTPAPAVAVLSAGYRPAIHPGASHD